MVTDFSSSSPVVFAAEQLRGTCASRSLPCPAFTLHQDPALPARAYRAHREGQAFMIAASDEEGAMNAVLDLKDSIEAYGTPQLKEGTVSPCIGCRGIKLNVPLDVRSPSYTDCGDSAQYNIAAMWDEGFWRGLTDRLALMRYNTLTLWNLCPFPSMVRIPEYPDAALEDVAVSSAMTGGTSRALGFYTPAMKEDLVTIRRMTIEQKIAFWHRVFGYARDRCIRIYIFTWNLYLYGLEDSGYDLKQDADDPGTARYIRCGTAALLREYPELAGIGVTAGENLCAEWTETQDMQWIRDTYGRGVEDVLAEDPGRPITLICRTHQTTLPLLEKAFADYSGKMDLSVKYAMAHITAAERPHFCDALLAVKRPGRGIWMTLRQDDFYLFPWADDEMLESLIQQMPKEDLQGFYYGADGMIWGTENQSRCPQLHDRYWIDKHFYATALLGFLGYRGHLEDSEKLAILRAAVPGLAGPELMNKYRHASRAVRLTSLVHWRNYDFQWYPEACCYLNEPDHTVVFDDLNSFLRTGACPGQNVLSAAESASQTHPEGRNALDIAEEMLHEADLADGISLPEGTDPAERELKADLERITLLARYYAFKLRAAVYLQRSRENHKDDDRDQAITDIRTAAEYWHRYAEETARWYRPQRLSRLRGVISPDMWDIRADRDILICMDRRK